MMDPKPAFNTDQWNQNSLVLVNSRLAETHRKIVIQQSHFFRHVSNPGDRVLDLGCGSGHFLRYFASKGFSNLYGVEPDEYLVSQIPKSIATVRIGVAEKLPFDTGFFDVVFIYGVLHHLKADTGAYRIACQEIDRVLKPGGVLFLIEPGRYRLFRAIEMAARILGRVSQLFRSFSQTMEEEQTEQHFFLKNHGVIRKQFLGQRYRVLNDKYFLYSWMFGVMKPAMNTPQGGAGS